MKVDTQHEGIQKALTDIAGLGVEAMSDEDRLDLISDAIKWLDEARSDVERAIIEREEQCKPNQT